MTIDVTEGWLDFVGELLDAKVRFLVVGAHALAVQGLPRPARFLDVWIEADAANGDRVWAALAAFGAPLTTLGIAHDDLKRPETVVQLGVPPNRIDLMTSMSGVSDFAKAWDAREERKLGDRVVPFLGREALMANM